MLVPGLPKRELYHRVRNIFVILYSFRLLLDRESKAGAEIKWKPFTTKLLETVYTNLESILCSEHILIRPRTIGVQEFDMRACFNTNTEYLVIKYAYHDIRLDGIQDPMEYFIDNDEHSLESYSYHDKEKILLLLIFLANKVFERYGLHRRMIYSLIDLYSKSYKVS